VALPHRPPPVASTFRCCHLCGALYTPAHPCGCRPRIVPHVLAHEARPAPPLTVWPLLGVAVVLVALLLGLLGAKGCP